MNRRLFTRFLPALPASVLVAIQNVGQRTTEPARATFKIVERDGGMWLQRTIRGRGWVSSVLEPVQQYPEKMWYWAHVAKDRIAVEVPVKDGVQALADLANRSYGSLAHWKP